MLYREIRFIGNLQTVTNIMIQDKIYIFTTEYQIKDGVHFRFDNIFEMTIEWLQRQSAQKPWGGLGLANIL